MADRRERGADRQDPAVARPAAGPTRRLALLHAFLAVWVAVLVWLAYLWVSTPYIGTGAAFFYGSPALALLLGTWAWARTDDHVRPWMHAAAAVLAVGWVVLALPALTGTGAEMALDGLILRLPLTRLAGVLLDGALVAVPFVASVGALALLLEVRHYELREAETGSGVEELASGDGAAR